MNAPIVAMVLCVFTQVATAQCVDSPTASSSPATAARPGGAELIKASAAVGRDVPVRHTTLAAHDTAPHPARREAAEPAPQQQRDDSALLWAALALMSGIALRRRNAGPQ